MKNGGVNFFPRSAPLGTAFRWVELQLNPPFQNSGSATTQHKLWNSLVWRSLSWLLSFWGKRTSLCWWVGNGEITWGKVFSLLFSDPIHKINADTNVLCSPRSNINDTQLRQHEYITWSQDKVTRSYVTSQTKCTKTVRVSDGPTQPSTPHTTVSAATTVGDRLTVQLSTFYLGLGDDIRLPPASPDKLQGMLFFC